MWFHISPENYRRPFVTAISSNHLPTLLKWAISIIIIVTISSTFLWTPVAALEPDCDDLVYEETENGTLQIETLYQLQCIGKGGSQASLDDDYILVSDIDATPTQDWAGGFEPIGLPGGLHRFIGQNAGDAFNGTFEGNSHSISGLYIDQRPEEPVPREDVQAIGMIAINEGDIKNLTLHNTEVRGNWFTGGLVGFNEFSGDIEGVHVSGLVTGYARVGVAVGRNIGYLENVSSNGLANGTRAIGGLMGGNTGLIVESSSSATANGHRWVGGFVGGNGGQIVNSQSSGNVSGISRIGGFTGYQVNATLSSRPYELVQVSAAGMVNGTYEVGGLVGYAEAETRVLDSFSHSIIRGEQVVGGLVGRNHGVISGGYATGSIEADQRVDAIAAVNNGSILNVYFDRTTTDISSSHGIGYGNPGTEPPADVMTGPTARNTLSLDFEGPWVTGAAGEYPRTSIVSAPLYRCGDISESGIYELVIEPYGLGLDACFNISAANVTINAAGKMVPNETLEGNYTSIQSELTRNPAPAIRVKGPTNLNGLNIGDLNISGWACGIALDGGEEVGHGNIRAIGGGQGICFDRSVGNSVANLTLVNNSNTTIEKYGLEDTGLTNFTFIDVDSWVLHTNLPETVADVRGERTNNVTNLRISRKGTEIRSYVWQNIVLRPEQGEYNVFTKYVAANLSNPEGIIGDIHLPDVGMPDIGSLWRVENGKLHHFSRIEDTDEGLMLNFPVDNLPTYPKTAEFMVLDEKSEPTVSIVSRSATVTTGRMIELPYRVENRVNIPLTMNVTFDIEGKPTKEAILFLDSGEMRNDSVSFKIGEETSGERTLRVNISGKGAETQVEVFLPDAGNDTSNESTDDGKSGLPPFWIIVIGLTVIVGLGIARWVLNRR